MEQLITASIGIAITPDKRVFIQIITADKENHYFIEMPRSSHVVANLIWNDHLGTCHFEDLHGTVQNIK